MSHDGGPSPMYWVIWMVFQNLRTFPGFPGISVVPNCSKWFLGGLDITECNWTQLEESGHPWVCLDSSRSFGLRQVLAGHPCRCRVSQAHSGSRIEVVEVREQLGGQGVLCIEVCCCMGWVVPSNHPLVGGIPCCPWVE